jgi:hypothetical protein
MFLVTTANIINQRTFSACVSVELHRVIMWEECLYIYIYNQSKGWNTWEKKYNKAFAEVISKLFF